MWMAPKGWHPKSSSDTHIYMGKTTQIRIYEAEDAYGRCSKWLDVQQTRAQKEGLG